MSIIRASICHALTSLQASSNVRKSIDKILEFLLTLAEVEDGELLSDEEEGWLVAILALLQNFVVYFYFILPRRLSQNR